MEGTSGISRHRQYNIKLVPGKEMSTLHVSHVQCTFTYIDISNVETTVYNADDSDLSKEKLVKDAMQGKSSLVGIPIFSSIASAVLTNDEDILNQGDKQKYQSLPTCVVNKRGSLMTQPFVPSAGYYKNKKRGLSVLNGIELAGNSDSSQKYADGVPQYLWTAQEITSVSLSGITYGNGSLQKTYGQRMAYYYISNKSCQQKGVDDKYIATRKYSCVSPEADEDKKGSIAFCYQYGPYTPLQNIKDKEHKTEAPNIILSIEGDIEGGKLTGQDVNVSGVRDGVVYVEMPPDGQITVKLNENHKAAGGLSVPSNDLLPPQCKRSNGEFTTKPLFIYPIYSGLVVTNSLIKNANNQGEEIFVPFPQKTDARFDLNFGSGAIEWYQLGSNMSDTTAMQKFPAFYQDMVNKSGGEKEHSKPLISLKERYKLNFDGKASLTMKKALCNFAICPLFFANSLYFDFYFKGTRATTASNENNKIPNFGSSGTVEYGSDSFSAISASNNLNYWFYPLAYNSQPGQEQEISAISATSFTETTKNKETIYKVPIHIQSDSTDDRRYPLEVLGGILVAQKHNAFSFDVMAQNGTFDMPIEITSKIPDYVSSSVTNNYLDYVTNCDLQCSLDGIQGSLTLDGYLFDSGGINFLKTTSGIEKKPAIQYTIGEIDLKVSAVSGTTDNITISDQGEIFRGFGIDVAVNNTDNNNSVTIGLLGMQKKMEDMKLICTPFWDGDRLQVICAYMQNYLKADLKMVNYEVQTMENALPVAGENQYVGQNWIAHKDTLIEDAEDSEYFRVGRSWNWQSPHINFNTGTSCLQALNHLAQDTSCVFVVGYDGVGYFYELNRWGYPYFVDRQIANQNSNRMFDANDIISINLHPELQSKFNEVITLGFLVQKGNNSRDLDTSVSTAPGIYYTRIKNDDVVNFPWQRATLSVQQGYLTKQQLLKAHCNRITRSLADFYSGTVTVKGNTEIKYIYEVIWLEGIPFLVNSISHNIDLQNKTWTTSYGIQWTSLFNQNNIYYK